MDYGTKILLIIQTASFAIVSLGVFVLLFIRIIFALDDYQQRIFKGKSEREFESNEKSEREFELMREALQPSKMIKPPLMWTKENGFNRAPTLGEAMQFKPSDDDEHNPMDTMC